MASITDISAKARPVMWLVAVNVAVYLLVAVAQIVAHTGASGVLYAIALNLSMPSAAVLWLDCPWTLVTYMFTHYDFLHLLVNMLCLFCFARLLGESDKSGRAVTALYLAGGLTGGVFYLALSALWPGFIHGAGLSGASASVLAVTVASAVVMPDRPVHLFFIGDVKLKWVALAMVLLGFLGLGGGLAGGQAAHIGGVAAGFVGGWLMRRPLALFSRRTRTPAERRNGRRARTISVIDSYRADRVRLDQLLDKIRLSGYNSLSRSEKSELETLSRKIGK